MTACIRIMRAVAAVLPGVEILSCGHRIADRGAPIDRPRRCPTCAGIRSGALPPVAVAAPQADPMPALEVVGRGVERVEVVEAVSEALGGATVRRCRHGAILDGGQDGSHLARLECRSCLVGGADRVDGGFDTGDFSDAYPDGGTHEQIARMLGCTKQGVERIEARGLRTLRGLGVSLEALREAWSDGTT